MNYQLKMQGFLSLIDAITLYFFSQIMLKILITRALYQFHKILIQ